MVQPIEGVQGKDFIIVNYVDWRDIGIVDAHCGTKTYDGHQGTDYSLRSFRQMDSAVDILAAAQGVVTFIQDGLFDRETEGNVSKRLGNYIAIRHPNKYYSYYGHLKSGSIMVKVGDTVAQGESLAAVGSSGNSTDAHLHFEVWYDSLYVVDPFSGTCGNANTLFLNQPVYDTFLHVWDYGMHDSVIDINALRERIETISKPFTFQPTAITPVLFWSHLSGFKKDDVLTIRWISPTQTEWYQYTVTMEQDWWYYYYFSYINNTNLAKGNWQAKLELNGKVIVTQPFLVDDNASVILNESSHAECQPASLTEIMNDKDLLSVKVTNASGQTIMVNRNHLHPNTNLQPGLYFIETETVHQKHCFYKILVN